MRVVIMGAPGAGKGTQSALLTKDWAVPHVSTGNLLREAVELETELGRRVQKTLASGRLVPDEMMIELLKERLGRQDCRNGFVLDGYPRTERQARDLDELLATMGATLDCTLLIEVPVGVVLRRLGNRRTCPSCQAVYSAEQIGESDRSTCERCGTTLVTRRDDEESTIRRRLQVYEEQTQPAVQHYRQQGKLKVVDGQGTPAEVHERLTSLAQMAKR